MKRKEIAATLFEIARECACIDGKVVAQSESGDRVEVGLRDVAAGVSAGLAYAEGLISGDLDPEGMSPAEQARSLVEAAGVVEAKFRKGDI